MVKDQEYQVRVKNIGPRKGEKKIKHYNCTLSVDQDRVFDIEDLRPFTTYDISVRQVLNGKESDWSMTGTARTLEAKPETAPEDFTGKSTSRTQIVSTFQLNRSVRVFNLAGNPL